MRRIRRVVLLGAFIVFVLTLTSVHTSPPAECTAKCGENPSVTCKCTGQGANCQATDGVGCHAVAIGCDDLKSCPG